MNAGLNLYSIRTMIQSEEDFLSVAEKLKNAGYSYLQYSGAPFDSEKIKRVCEKSGMPVYLTHVPMDRILSDTEKLMEEHGSFGCKNIGLGSMPASTVSDMDACKKKVEELNEAGRVMKENGFKFFYHHHHFESIKWENGMTPFEYIIENTENINFTVDTYWLQYSGLDVCSFIDKLSGRIECAHLKDYRINAKKNDEGITRFEPGFAPVGYGNLDFKNITEHLKKAGTKYFFVEQDDAVDYSDPLAEVIKSINYINKEL